MLAVPKWHLVAQLQKWQLPCPAAERQEHEIHAINQYSYVYLKGEARHV